MAALTRDYDITEHNPDSGRLLLYSTSGMWAVVDLIPGQPIRMTWTEDEAEARAVFAT